MLAGTQHCLDVGHCPPGAVCGQPRPGGVWEGGGHHTGPCHSPRGGRREAEGLQAALSVRLIYGRVRGQWAERLNDPLCGG